MSPIMPRVRLKHTWTRRIITCRSGSDLGGTQFKVLFSQEYFFLPLMTTILSLYSQPICTMDCWLYFYQYNDRARSLTNEVYIWYWLTIAKCNTANTCYGLRYSYSKSPFPSHWNSLPSYRNRNMCAVLNIDDSFKRTSPNDCTRQVLFDVITFTISIC